MSEYEWWQLSAPLEMAVMRRMGLKFPQVEEWMTPTDRYSLWANRYNDMPLPDPVIVEDENRHLIQMRDGTGWEGFKQRYPAERMFWAHIEYRPPETFNFTFNVPTLLPPDWERTGLYGLFSAITLDYHDDEGEQE